ncbi:hypothetical protein ACFL4W_02500 [Planctomycetota bacterium]
MRLLLLICLTSLIVFCACGKKGTAADTPKPKTGETAAGPTGEEKCKGPKVLTIVFLSGDAAKDNPLLKQVAEARGGEAKLCVMTIDQKQMEDAAIKALTDFLRVTAFPVVTLDGLPVTGEATVAAALKEHLGCRMAGAEAKLENEINDKGEAELLFFGCADKSGPLENGRMFVLAALSEKLAAPEMKVHRLKAVIADRPDYSVTAGSCHVPETLNWKIPENLAEGLTVIAAICDSEGRVLGMACSCACKKGAGKVCGSKKGCDKGQKHCE